MVADADGREVEHHVGDNGADDAPCHLGRDVGEGVAPAQAAEACVDQRDDGVEVSAGNRPEHEDEREQTGRSRGGVLQKLKAGVVR